MSSDTRRKLPQFLGYPLFLPLSGSGTVGRIPFRSLKRILDHSKARFIANPKLALWAQTLNLPPFRFTKNGQLKFFNLRSSEPGQRSIPVSRLRLRGGGWGRGAMSEELRVKNYESGVREQWAVRSRDEGINTLWEQFVPVFPSCSPSMGKLLPGNACPKQEATLSTTPNSYIQKPGNWFTFFEDVRFLLIFQNLAG